MNILNFGSFPKGKTLDFHQLATVTWLVESGVPFYVATPNIVGYDGIRCNLMRYNGMYVQQKLIFNWYHRLVEV